jgi:hypothetical protein
MKLLNISNVKGILMDSEKLYEPMLIIPRCNHVDSVKTAGYVFPSTRITV